SVPWCKPFGGADTSRTTNPKASQRQPPPPHNPFHTLRRLNATNKEPDAKAGRLLPQAPPIGCALPRPRAEFVAEVIDLGGASVLSAFVPRYGTWHGLPAHGHQVERHRFREMFAFRGNGD